jgi:hypothetical protein
MATQVSLAIPVDIKFSDDDAAQHWTLPDARVDGFTAPHDIAWQTDVNGHKPCSHFSYRRFASLPQTVLEHPQKLFECCATGLSSA